MATLAAFAHLCHYGDMAKVGALLSFVESFGIYLTRCEHCSCMAILAAYWSLWRFTHFFTALSFSGDMAMVASLLYLVEKTHCFY